MPRTDEQRLKHTEYMRAYRQKNPAYMECMKLYRRKYYDRNREAVIDTAKKWAIENQDRARKNKRANFERHKERYLENEKKRIAANIEDYREYQRRYQNGRRAKMGKGKIDFDAVVARCNNICGVCDKPIVGKFHFDHIVPIARGGHHVTENLQQAHGKCNLMKHVKIGFKIEAVP